MGVAGDICDVTDHLVAVFVLAGSAFISLSLSIVCYWDYLPIAIAGQLAATAWVFRNTEIRVLRKVMIVLSILLLMLHIRQIWLFTWHIAASLVGKTLSIHDSRALVVESPLIQLGVPAILVAVALWFMLMRRQDDQPLLRLLFGMTMGLLLAIVCYMVKSAFLPVPAGETGTTTDNIYALAFAYDASFFKRGVLSIFFALTGLGLVVAQSRWGLGFVNGWGRWLTHLCAARLVYFDAVLKNPLFDHSQFVGDMVLTNGLTLVYGGGAALAAYVLTRCDDILTSSYARNAYQCVGGTMLFLWVTLSVRHVFHGGNLFPGETSIFEFYGYSMAWLVTGVVLLWVGIWRDIRPMRILAVGFVGLTILKVFIFDAAELEGLYRVFSFLGLGIGLIGLSYFYTKFVHSADVQGRAVDKIT